MAVSGYVWGRAQPMRTALSVVGVGLCLVLMLFLLGVYQGVARGSLEFIEQSGADFWILQRNATNLLRCTSVLWYHDRQRLERVPGVRSATPLLLLLATVTTVDCDATVYLVGYDPVTGTGGPPRVVAGRAVRSIDEVVLDQAFARKYGYALGDTVAFHNCRLVLVGISGGTNAFVVQYAFVTLERAWRISGYQDIVTCFIVKCDRGVDPATVAAGCDGLIAEAGVIAHQRFVQHNRRELQAGFLPFVITLVILGAVVLSVLLSLLLFIAIMESRADLAVIKALGAPRYHVPVLVLAQSILLVLSGAIPAMALFPLLRRLLESLTPEMGVIVDGGHLIMVGAAALFMAVISALPSVFKAQSFYAEEAFS